VETWRAHNCIQPLQGSKVATFDQETWEDAFNVMCGNKISEGTYRTVFVCKFDPELVVKVEKEYGTFMNIHEWRNWELLQDADHIKRWLAPCKFISPNGRVLVQYRTLPLYPDDMPEKVPNFLTDLKWENFGRWRGNVVCHDYPMVIANASYRLKKANWR
jgi:hypothetical protein